ncbi:MAG: hypothetical protein M1839_000615 [Geoglossum umbratile]|nr:MAG: hypothetical protein M1839_000615 [Geoglossum umbratile]
MALKVTSLHAGLKESERAAVAQSFREDNDIQILVCSYNVSALGLYPHTDCWNCILFEAGKNTETQGYKRGRGSILCQSEEYDLNDPKTIELAIDIVHQRLNGQAVRRLDSNVVSMDMDYSATQELYIVQDILSNFVRNYSFMVRKLLFLFKVNPELSSLPTE